MIWIAPAAVLCAFLSCLSIAFSWTAAAWIFGILSFVAGLELLSRITISGNRMDTPINPGGAFETYNQFYKMYKAKYPLTKDLERAGMAASSYFDGSGAELLGYLFWCFLVRALDSLGDPHNHYLWNIFLFCSCCTEKMGVKPYIY